MAGFGCPPRTRKQLKRDLQRLYGLRSKISHSGSRSVLYSDFYRLHEIARGFIAAMITYRNDFRTKEDLLQWLDERRLGA
jgi:hypothetical protein